MVNYISKGPNKSLERHPWASLGLEGKTDSKENIVFEFLEPDYALCLLGLESEVATKQKTRVKTAAWSTV